MTTSHDAGLSAKRSHQYAAESGLQELYKFRAFASEKERQYVAEILLENKVYFPRPSQLNDDRDLRPPVKLRRGINDLDTRQRLLADAEVVWERNHVPSEDRVRYRKRLLQEALDIIELESVLKAHDRLEEYGVLSLSSSRDYLKMWERYADNRRGVCIHFRCALGTPFGFSQRVDYVHVLDPLLVPFDDMEEREIARRATLSKLVQWQEEREYRFLLYPGTSFDEAGLHIQGRYGYFNPGEVVGVSVGDQMPEQYLEELKAMLRERAGGAVPLFRARV